MTTKKCFIKSEKKNETEKKLQNSCMILLCLCRCWKKREISLHILRPFSYGLKKFISYVYLKHTQKRAERKKSWKWNEIQKDSRGNELLMVEDGTNVHIISAQHCWQYFFPFEIFNLITSPKWKLSSFFKWAAFALCSFYSRARSYFAKVKNEHFSYITSFCSTFKCNVYHIHRFQLL